MDSPYIGSLVLLLVGILNVFHIQVANDLVNGIVVGVVSLFIAIQRYREGNITLAGVKK